MENNINLILQKFKQLKISLSDNDVRDFDEFVKLICQKEIIDLTGSLIRLLGIEPLVSARDLLAGYVICSYSSEILTTDVNSTNLISGDSDLYTAAMCLISAFEMCVERRWIGLGGENAINSRYRQIVSLLNTTARKYSETFNEWKKQDAEKLIINFIKTHYELQKMLDIILLDVSSGVELTKDQSEWKKEIHDYQRLIRNKLVVIGGDGVLSRLGSSSSEGIEDGTTEINVFYDQIRGVAESAFWNIFTEELRAEPPNTNRIVGLFSEIRDLLCSLTPHNARICVETHDKLDVIIVKQLLDHNTMDGSTFMGYLHYILYRIRFLEAPADNEETDRLISKINEDLRGKEGFVYADILPNLFKALFDKIYKIKKDVQEFHRLTQNQFVNTKDPKVI